MFLQICLLFQVAESFKARGNQYYAAGQYQQAVEAYTLATRYLEDRDVRECLGGASQDIHDRVHDIKLCCVNNIAAAHTKIG